MRDPMKRIVDSDPATILLIAAVVGATAGAASATIAVINLKKTHFKERGTRIRGKLLVHLNKIESAVEHVVADLSIVERVLAGAKFDEGPTIRLGNGAHVSPDEFRRYLKASDNIMKGLTTINRETLKVEELAGRIGYVEEKLLTNDAGKALQLFRGVLESRNAPLRKTFDDIRNGIKHTESVIQDLRRQLDD